MKHILTGTCFATRASWRIYSETHFNLEYVSIRERAGAYIVKQIFITAIIGNPSLNGQVNCRLLEYYMRGLGTGTNYIVFYFFHEKDC